MKQFTQPRGEENGQGPLRQQQEKHWIPEGHDKSSQPSPLVPQVIRCEHFPLQAFEFGENMAKFPTSSQYIAKLVIIKSRKFGIYADFSRVSTNLGRKFGETSDLLDDTKSD